MTLVPVYVRGCVSAGAIAPTVSEESLLDASYLHPQVYMRVE